MSGWDRGAQRFPPGQPRRSFPPATLLAGLAFSGDLLFWHLAIINTTVANATFFATTAPLFVVIVTWLVLRQRVSAGMLVGLALCLAGGGALIGQSLVVDPGRIRGDLFGLATAFFFGLYFILVSRARETQRRGPGDVRGDFDHRRVPARRRLVARRAAASHRL